MDRHGLVRRGGLFLPAAAAAISLTLGGLAEATSQGPVADGPYVGTLPCADCACIRTALALYKMGEGGEPLVYRMTATYLGTPEGDRTEERPIHTTHDLGLQRDEAAVAARLQSPRTLFRGTLTREADRLLLAPCGGGRTLRVQDVSPEVIITAAITDIGFDERDSLYLEAWGNLRDGELWIDRLNRAGIEMGCPQDAIGFRAVGNEPGWSVASDRTALRFTTQDGVTLSAPPLPLSWRWPGGRPDRAEAVLVTATESSAFEVVLAPTICRDTMADAVFGFTATVRFSRPEPSTGFEGCAFLGSESLPGHR